MPDLYAPIFRPSGQGTGAFVTEPPFSQIGAVKALCEDGKVRKFRVGIPDTYFSMPARGSIKGRSVRGSVMYGKSVGGWCKNDNAPDEYVYTFHEHKTQADKGAKPI